MQATEMPATPKCMDFLKLFFTRRTQKKGIQKKEVKSLLQEKSLIEKKIFCINVM